MEPGRALILIDLLSHQGVPDRTPFLLAAASLRERPSTIGIFRLG